jgi:hypothetical protein
MTDVTISLIDGLTNGHKSAALGGFSHDYAYSIQQTTDSGFIIAGTSSSNDDDVSGNHGSSDYWIVKLGSDMPTEVTSLSRNLIFIYPNPVRTQLTVTLATSAYDVTILVYDLLGRMIALQTTFQNTQALFNTTILANGFYTLQITDNKTGKREVEKFVKQQ